MSSLAAARADNFYYPPDWTPEAGSLNKFAGAPPGNLGKRAKKLDQGILVIRFEMPFNVWCTGCRHMIAKGVRFNAEKRGVGKYYSTRIWAFTMKTPCCGTEVEIHTDPKACEYVLVRGAERKTESYSAADAETTALPDAAEREALRADPIARLEGSIADAAHAKAAAPSLHELERRSAVISRDDYTANKALRRAMRAQRGAAAAAAAERDALGLPQHVALLPPSAEDAAAAASVRFAPVGGGFDAHRAAARAALRRGGIFAGAAASAAAPKRGGEAEARAALLAKRCRLEAAGVRFGDGAASAAAADVFGGGLRAAPRAALRPAPRREP